MVVGMVISNSEGMSEEPGRGRVAGSLAGPAPRLGQPVGDRPWCACRCNQATIMADSALTAC